MKPVVANPGKVLKKAFKSLSLTAESKKINMKDSSSDESEEEQPSSGITKTIQKKRVLSRADYKEMKKELKRRAKSGASGSKRRVEKLRLLQDEFVMKVRGQSQM